MKRIAFAPKVPLLDRWIGRFATRWDAGGRNVRIQLRRIVGALLAIQALLALALVGTTAATSHRVNVLVLDRLYPIGELQRVNASYANALLTANKVRSGNLSAAGAIATIQATRAEIATNWSAFTHHHLDTRRASQVAHVESARHDADAALDTLHDLLRAKRIDQLDFFVSGPLYAAIDPLTASSTTLMTDLRADAARERAALDAGFLQVFLLVAFVTAAALLVAVWGMRMLTLRVVRPLALIAEATRDITLERADAPIPALDRSDEIGDIARALVFGPPTRSMPTSGARTPRARNAPRISTRCSKCSSGPPGSRCASSPRPARRCARPPRRCRARRGRPRSMRWRPPR